MHAIGVRRSRGRAEWNSTSPPVITPGARSSRVTA